MTDIYATHKIRRAVFQRLHRWRWSHYRLAEAAHSRHGVGRSTIYRWLAVPAHRPSTSTVEAVLNVLDLEVQPREDITKGATQCQSQT